MASESTRAKPEFLFTIIKISETLLSIEKLQKDILREFRTLNPSQKSLVKYTAPIIKTALIATIKQAIAQDESWLDFMQE